MKKLSVILMAAFLASLIASAAFATPRIDARQAHQRARIAQGRARGDLTRGEVARLRADQRHVRRMERRADADGMVARGERRSIERAQDRQSRAIYRLKHNGRVRI